MTSKVKRHRHTDPTKQLTEEQKKLHHIQSEHRRRQQIRATFDRLVEIVPDLEAREKRSELTVITKTSNYIAKLRAENEMLINRARSKGVNISESWFK